jgi:hypothetical protein
MIQAHELRIGNLVKASVMVEPIQVFTITFDRRDGYFINTHIPIEDIQPIPLTPEILESLGLPDQEINEKGCGWFHRGNFLVGKTKYHYHFHKNSKRLTLAIVVTLEKGSDTTAFAWDIYYVHQLQNLYHALTFKELNVVDGKSYLCSR